MDLDQKKIQKQDPIKRIVERQNESEEFSPMDPPDAFNPPALDAIKYEDMHPILQSFMDEHVKCNKVVNKFENAMNSLQTEGFSKLTLNEINDFYTFFDDAVIVHNHNEDKTVFAELNSILHKKEIYSSGSKKTVVDLLEEDHIKMLQLAAISFNLFGLITRISDENSRLLILDLAVEQSKVLIETMKLHIFREDNVVFPMAQTYLSTKIFDQFNINTQ